MAQQLTGTLSNFISRTRTWARETNADISQWTDPFVKEVFNAQYRKRSAELIMAHEGFFTIVGTRDIIGNQSRYAWPAGFQRLLKLELVRIDGRTIPIQRWERHFSVNPVANTGGDSYLPSYRPIGSGFVLEPAPLETVTNGLRMEWNGVPSELTADGDSLHSDFPTILDEILVLDTVVALFDQEGVQESGQVRTILRLRMEWEERWDRFIDGRMVSTQSVTPFMAHYHDA